LTHRTSPLCSLATGRAVKKGFRGDLVLAVVVSLEEERGKARKPSLDQLVELVGEDLRQVNALILQRMQSPVALIPQLAGHIIAAGGKRLRPALRLSRQPSPRAGGGG